MTGVTSEFNTAVDLSEPDLIGYIYSLGLAQIATVFELSDKISLSIKHF
jgi:hypothetical protein